MSTSDGQKANAITFNNGYVSRLVDSNTIGKVDVENADAANSGPTIQNIQREMNGEATFTGKAINAAKDIKPVWLDNGVGISTDNLKDRSDALTTQAALNATNIGANTSDIADVRTTQGTADGDTDLGTFTGTIITDNVSVKAALQEIETALEPITDALDFQGLWDANANSPALADGVGTKGHFYIVDTAGTTSLDGIADWAIGDWAIFDGTVWRKIDNTDAVSSVNSQTGVVVLDTDDVAEGTVNKYASGAQQSWKTKVTKGFGDFTNVAASQDIEIYNLAANEIIHAIIIKHSTAFSGGTLTGYEVSVGITGTLDKYVSFFDVFQAIGDGVKKVSQVFELESFAGATSIKMNATATGDTLNNAAAGSLDFWILTSTLT